MKIKVVFIIAWCAFNLNCNLINGPKKDYYYQARIEIRAANVEVSLNGWPVADLDGEKVPQERLDQITEYVVDGKNELKVNFRNADPEKSEVKITILQSSPGSKEPKAISTLDLKSSGEEEFPHEITKQLRLSSKVEKWQWERADKLELTENLKKRALNFIKSYRSALVKKDLDYVIKVSEPYLRDAASMYSSNLEEAGRRFRETLEGIFNEGFEVAPFPEGELSYTTIAHGRVLETVSEKNTPPISLRLKGEELAIYLSIGRINGEFAVLKFRM